MKFILINFTFLTLVSHFKSIIQNCTLTNCPSKFGECLNDVCLCGPGYTTIESSINKADSQNFQFCNYAYKYNEYAAYYEALFPFGAGHFYTERYLHAILKFLLFWFVSLNRIIFHKTIKLYPIIEWLNNYMLWVFAICYLTDYLGFSYNYYKDGNGVTLL